MSSVVEDVTSLAERTQVTQPIVARIAVKVSCGENDPSVAKPGGVDQVRPPAGTAAAVPPCLRRRIEPSTVRQTPEFGEMRPTTMLTAAAGAAEPYLGTKLAPVRRIQRSKSSPDRHGLWARAGYLCKGTREIKGRHKQ